MFIIRLSRKLSSLSDLATVNFALDGAVLIVPSSYLPHFLIARLGLSLR